MIANTLDDYAAAYYGFLILNEERFSKLPMTLKRYVYAHECAHQYVGRGELAADCYAVRQGRREGWLDEKRRGHDLRLHRTGKGEPAHPAGPEGAANTFAPAFRIRPSRTQLCDQRSWPHAQSALGVRQTKQPGKKPWKSSPR